MIGTHALEERVGAGLAHLKRGTPAPVRDAAPVDVRDCPLEELQVFFREVDAPALRQPGECLAGLTAVDHEDPFAGAQQAVADGALQSLTERQQQDDRECSPRHGEEREEGPGPLRLQIADEFPEEDGEHA